MVKSDVEAIPPDHGGGGEARQDIVVRACVLVLLTAGLVIILQVLSSVSWEWGSEWDVFKFGYGCAIVLLLGQAMYSVRLYPFIPYTITAHTYCLLRSAFTTLLVSDRLFAAILMEVRPPHQYRSLHANRLSNGAIVVRRNVGYADGPQPTWQKLARLVVGAGFPAVTLYYNNDIGASLLLFRWSTPCKRTTAAWERICKRSSP